MLSVVDGGMARECGHGVVDEEERHQPDRPPEGKNPLRAVPINLRHDPKFYDFGLPMPIHNFAEFG